MDCRCLWIFCRLFCYIFISALVAVLLITLASVDEKPRFYIEQIYIPAFNNSIYFTKLNTSIFMELKFKRDLARVPIRYVDLKSTLYYGSDRSFFVGYSVVPGLYQGTKNKTLRRRVVVEAGGLPYADALQKIAGGSTVPLVVELTMNYKLRPCDGAYDCSDTKAKAVVVRVDVAVDGSGVAVSKKPIRLR